MNRDIEKKVSGIIDANNLYNKIIFKEGTLQVAPYYIACDLLVFPSTHPHQARPIFEAGAAGIPVVISDFSQTSEFASDKITALVFKPNDPAALAKTIDYAFSQSEICSKIVENNLKLVLVRHDYRTLANELNDFLSS